MKLLHKLLCLRYAGCSLGRARRALPPRGFSVTVPPPRMPVVEVAPFAGAELQRHDDRRVACGASGMFAQASLLPDQP